MLELRSQTVFYTDSIYINQLFVPTINLGPDTAVCEGAGYFLDATVPSSTYLWQDGSTNSTITPDSTGLYSVDVLFSGACPISASAFITVNPYPVFDLGPDTALCPGESITLDATYPGATYTWQDNANTATYNVTGPGIYFVDVDVAGCATLDAITVNYAVDPNLDLGPDTTFCDGNNLVMDATTTNATYEWQDGSTLGTFNTTIGGTFWVEIDIFGCVYSDTMTLDVDPIPVIDLGLDTTLCPWDSMMVNASFDNSTIPLARQQYKCGPVDHRTWIVSCSSRSFWLYLR